VSETTNTGELIEQALRESIRVKQAVADSMVGDIARMAEIVIEAYESGGKMVVFGNGGSAADAQHLAGEMVVKLRLERRALPAIALNTNASIMTAASNDYGYEYVFSRQIDAWVKKEDVVIAISTSGTSPNVVQALKKARELGARTVLMTGTRGTSLLPLADLVLAVPSGDTVRIQEAHITIGHIVCELVERYLASSER